MKTAKDMVALAYEFHKPELNKILGLITERAVLGELSIEFKGYSDISNFTLDSLVGLGFSVRKYKAGNMHGVPECTSIYWKN